MRVILILFGLGLLFFGGALAYIETHKPLWEKRASFMIEKAKDAGRSLDNWEKIQQQYDESFPPHYPFNKGARIIDGLTDLLELQNELPKLEISPNATIVPYSDIEAYILLGKKTQYRLKNLYRELDKFPLWGLNEGQKEKFHSYFDALEQLIQHSRMITVLEEVYKDLKKHNKNIVILLQNNNEIRSTGGFGGSLLILDFQENGVGVSFRDIYSIDRLVSIEDQIPAPEFFHSLSKTISLRDANFWPDFPTSARTYQKFFSDAGLEVPSIFAVVNLNLVREWVKITGPITIPKWKTTLNEYNFDLVLQFLVESKITGRWSPKAPVEMFLFEMIKRTRRTDDFAKRLVSEINWKKFQEQKNILAYSNYPKLNKLFERFHLDGILEFHPQSDNQLYFDFISVGANKSDKFMWNKIEHNSNIDRDGNVKNTLKIKRSHSLRPGELEQIIGLDQWPENVKNLIDGTLRWKLGGGENRTVLRITVPKTAQLIRSEIPYSSLTEAEGQTPETKQWIIPLNILPTESKEVFLEYETKIKRGSTSWRPYFLHLVGTPSIDRTKFLSTITAPNGSQFEAMTDNIGIPVPLTNQQLRTIIRIPKEY